MLFALLYSLSLALAVSAANIDARDLNTTLTRSSKTDQTQTATVTASVSNVVTASLPSTSSANPSSSGATSNAISGYVNLEARPGVHLSRIGCPVTEDCIDVKSLKFQGDQLKSYPGFYYVNNETRITCRVGGYWNGTAGASISWIFSPGPSYLAPCMMQYGIGIDCDVIDPTCT